MAANPESLRLVDDLLDSALLLYDEIGDLTVDLRDTLEWVDDLTLLPSKVRRMARLKTLFEDFTLRVARCRLAHDALRVNMELPRLIEDS